MYASTQSKPIKKRGAISGGISQYAPDKPIICTAMTFDLTTKKKCKEIREKKQLKSHQKKKISQIKLCHQ